MARKKSPQVIDGFRSVQAVKHASTRATPPRTESATAKASSAPKPPEEKRATRIGQTAVPVTHRIVCYECGYAHNVRGHIHHTFCPKCRTELDTGDHTLTHGWDGDLKTIGRVTIPKGVELNGGTIMSGIIVVGGDATKCKLHAGDRLELCDNAKLNTATTTAKNIIVSEEHTIAIKAFSCENLEVRGTLKANVVSSGEVRILPGGLIKGSFEGRHLIVEEGGGLKATVRLYPEEADAARHEGAAA